MKQLVMPAMAAFGLCVAAPANAAAFINFTGTAPIAGLNDFRTELSSLGLTQMTTLGESIILNSGSTITFEFLGSESGFNDTFSTPSLSFTESSSLVNNFGSPVLIGSDTFSAGTLAGLLNFTSSGGAPATVGTDGFTIFLGPNAVSGDAHSIFYFGYDDQLTSPDDDDYDDFVVRATVVSSAVPESATWAMMLLGFLGAGIAVRRGRKTGFRQVA